MADVAVIKPKPDKNKRYMLVRYGHTNTIGLFEHNEQNIPKRQTRVVVKTEKGLELGFLIGQFAPYKSGQFRYSPEELKKYYLDNEVEFPDQPAGRFIRFATDEDIGEEKHLQKLAKEEMNFCRKAAAELNLKMKVVDVEHIFGGERVIFYFMADGRVDFRELVKKLAHEYQSRIEMRQIGSRDEAKLLGDIESCGRVCCCAQFLKALKPVNMRMAKMQKATLDPSKISGYCGRLKCCLRYEDQTYLDLKKLLPRKRALVRTKHGQGRVVDGQILSQLVMVELEDGQKVSVPLGEIEIIEQPPATMDSDEQVSEDDTRESGSENASEQKSIEKQDLQNPDTEAKTSQEPETSQ